MAQVFLGIGTNLGDKYANLTQAISLIETRAGRLTAVSPIYQTQPFGERLQPVFWNGCVQLETMLPPETLLRTLKDIEQEMGRVPTYHWGPRLIDIDILFYDDLVLQTDLVTIPHVGMTERAFVLFPLRDIAPDKQHPVNRKTVAELFKAVARERLPQLPVILT